MLTVLRFVDQSGVARACGVFQVTQQLFKNDDTDQILLATLLFPFSLFSLYVLCVLNENIPKISPKLYRNFWTSKSRKFGNVIRSFLIMALNDKYIFGSNYLVKVCFYLDVYSIG